MLVPQGLKIKCDGFCSRMRVSCQGHSHTLQIYYGVVLKQCLISRGLLSILPKGIFMVTIIPCIFKKYLFIWLHLVLVALCGIFSCHIWDLALQSMIEPIEPRPPALRAWSLKPPGKPPNTPPCCHAF